MQTLEWVKSHELPTGGIEAWAGLGRAYPECTGYLIPTLLAYGEQELAERLGSWLESIQHPDGSFDGLDGIPRAFDTGACLEGLEALGRTESADRARAWLLAQRVPGGLRIHANTTDMHIYNLRAMAIAGEHLTQIPNLPFDRTHYLAYALEGLYRMGLDITEHLKPYAGGQTLLHKDERGSDTSATAQIAVLCLKNNIPCDGLIDAVRAMVDSDGGVFHDSGDRRKCAWTAKYYLDMERLCQKDTQSFEQREDTSALKKKKPRKSG